MLNTVRNYCSSGLYILSLILLFPVYVLKGQTPRIFKNDLKSDLMLLQDSLKKYYPSTCLDSNKRQIDQVLQDGDLPVQMTADEALAILKKVAANLKDGHVYAGPSPALSSFVEKNALFFPLRLYFENDRTRLAAPFKGIAPGAELLRINGVPLADIRSKLFSYMRGDGAITTQKRQLLNRAFYFYYFLVYGQQSSFEVTIRLPDQRLQQLRVAAIPEAQLATVPEFTRKEKLLDLSFPEAGIALLRIGSFATDKLAAQQLDFPRFLSNAFQQIAARNIRSLVIDLRGNGGGRDLYGSLLYRYLSPVPFRYYHSLTAATTLLPYQEFTKANSSYNDLQASMLRPVDDGYALDTTAHHNLALQYPLPLTYRGKVIFLIDGQTFSTAAEFCAIAHRYKRGKFVGEETGGMAAGNISGAIKNITLPATGFTFSFGLIRYQMAASPGLPNRGVIPDYPLEMKLHDVLHNNDPPLDLALKIAH